MELLKFKQEYKHDLVNEFNKIDFRLRFIVMSWSAELQYRFSYAPTVTEIFRTAEEQKYIYTVIAPQEMIDKYKANPFHSVHEYGRGIDFRASDMSDEMIEFTKSFFSHIPYDIDRGLKTLVYHDINAGIHLHIQINSKGLSCIRSTEL